MKNYTLIVFTLALCLPAAAQTRQRYFDNLEAMNSVAIGDRLRNGEDREIRRSPTPTIRAPSSPYLPSPGVEPPRSHPERIVRKTAQVTMTVYEGYSESRPAGISPAAHAERLPMGSSRELRGYSTGNAYVDSLIVESSKRYDIDPLLIFAQMGQESSYKERAVSHKGASGLMQLMPATARRLGVTNIFDPKQNIDGGVKYMRMLLNMFSGDLRLALAGYNAGEGAVMKYGYKIPPYNETQDYVKRISARYKAMTGIDTAQRTPKRPSNTTTTPQQAAFTPSTTTIRTADGRSRLVNR